MAKEDEMVPDPTLLAQHRVLALAESTFAVLTALVGANGLPGLVLLQVQQGDLNAMKAVQQFQHGLNGIGQLLLDMDSSVVKPVEAPTGDKPSSIILPK